MDEDPFNRPPPQVLAELFDDLHAETEHGFPSCWTIHGRLAQGRRYGLGMLFEERIDAQEDGRVAVAWHVLKPGQPSFWDVPLDDALYLVGISSGPLDARVFRGAALLDRQRAGRPRDGLPSSVKKKFSLLLDEAFRGEIAVVTGAAIRVGGRLGFTVEAIAERATMAVRDAVHRMRSSAPPAPPKP